MTFEKREDNCWHWEYTGPYPKASVKMLRRFWAAAMILAFVILAFTALRVGITKESIVPILLTGLSMGLGITLVFVLLWWDDQRGKKGCSYTANDVGFSMFSSLRTGKHSPFHYYLVKTLSRDKARNAIVMNAAEARITVYADDDDYEAVWNYFAEHCPDAAITEMPDEERK